MPRTHCSQAGKNLMICVHWRALHSCLIVFGIFLMSCLGRMPYWMALWILRKTIDVDLPKALAIVLMEYPMRLSLMYAEASLFIRLILRFFLSIGHLSNSVRICYLGSCSSELRSVFICSFLSPFLDLAYHDFGDCQRGQYDYCL